MQSWSLNEKEQEGLGDFLDSKQEKRKFIALIQLKIATRRKRFLLGKEALLHFEEICQEGVSELHPQSFRKGGMLAQVQGG